MKDKRNLPAGLYIVAIDIGNAQDITIRAMETLRLCHSLICEERRTGIRLLKSLGLEKPLYLLNEHSKAMEIKQLFEELLMMKDKVVALISDAGTPGFADPGAELIQLCHEYNVAVHPIPGASSLMTAIMVSGVKADRFFYYGFLSAKKEERQAELKQLKTMNRYDIVFLEAPYRIKSILEDMKSILGKNRRARLFYKLTQPQQAIILGSLDELSRKSQHLPKGEFILILEHDKRN
ncbi:MAG: 16S rRNA (cytidine(1402)-2'-O)-methyltransferase [Candidatus Cloacimonetes bacterium]|nr:16S rRNA (cytidine(1402)-2'-O)-methyltransferase [Candidatus Cloacimonadota bacterium]